MTVTTYQEYVPPTQVPTEGKGAVYLRFENLPKGEAGPTLGPHPCVTLSLDSIQVGPDYVETARSRDNLWSLSKDNSKWTHVTIFSTEPGQQDTFRRFSDSSGLCLPSADLRR